MKPRSVWRVTHWQTASLRTAVHPLHVQHGSEQADVVVHSAERLHAFKQLQTGRQRTFESRPVSEWAGLQIPPPFTSME